MESLHTVKVFHGDGLSVSLLASSETVSSEVIRQALEKMQVYEDKTFYQLYEGKVGEAESSWRPLMEEDRPAHIQEGWTKKDLRLYLKRKDRESLELSNIIARHFTLEATSELVNDLCLLEDLSEETMVTNLKARFSKNSIYTYVGSILVSINPYYFFAIYNPKHTAMYQGKPLGQLPPHIFAVADDAYSSMLADKENQSIVISGESGAGKTEATKFLLHHLMSLSAKIDKAQSLELITLGTGPVLEAFGNAMTVANDNSSRFGKFIQVKFKENGAYYGASIEKYLLEKSRIISHSEGERNYHVFYYLLAGMEPEMRKKLHLCDSQQYGYLSGERIPVLLGSTQYQKLRESLDMLNFSEVTQLRMFTVLAAILHIGNITFVKNDDCVSVDNVGALEVVSELLQVPKETLKLALTYRRTRAGKGLEYFTTPYKLDEAIITRDSLAKGLYGALFDWIVDKVNESLTPDSSHSTHKGNCIGVLDIFGFEVFQKNRFEQFCINFANEHLQQYFNKHVFQREQAEYIAEGINWVSVVYVDNSECIDLIAKRPTGLLHLLDEECSFPGADDRSLLQKFDSQHKSHLYYKSPQVKLADPTFSIVHYAKEVSYCIKGFREKNSEVMRQDIVDVLTTSKADLVRAMIGLPSYAIHRWHMAFLKYQAVMALMGPLQLGGADGAGGRRSANTSPQKLCRAGSTPSSTSSTPLRAGSTPVGVAVAERNDVAITVPITNKRLSAEPFDFEYGGVLSSSFGFRTNRTYDLVKRSRAQATRDHKSKSSSSSPSPDQELGRHSRQGSLEVGDLPPRLRSGSSSEMGAEERKRGPSGGRKRSLTRDDSRSRLPSISQIQEKFRARLSRSKKVGAERSGHSWFSKSAHKMHPGDPKEKSSFGRYSAARHGSTPRTVSGQFHQSLLALMDTLEQTHPYFVRCIKSNNKKANCEFDSELVLRQLRYTGMMETVRIRKAGYPVRMTFENFYEKYQFLIGARKPDLPGQIHEFLASIGGYEGIQIGKTKVFMRDTQKRVLQKRLKEQVLDRIVVIQRWFRAKLQRCRYLHMRRCTIVLQSLVRGWLARRRADQMRTKICSAVVIQSAWRGWTLRRRYLILKHSTVLIQAYWRGHRMRKRYQVLLSEHKKEQEADRKRLEETMRVERLEQEKDKLERERQRLLEKMKEHQEEMSVTGGSQEVKQDEVDNSRVTTSLGMSSNMMSSAVRDMWDVLSKFDHVLEDMKRLSSGSDCMVPPDPIPVQTTGPQSTNPDPIPVQTAGPQSTNPEPIPVQTTGPQSINPGPTPVVAPLVTDYQQATPPTPPTQSPSVDLKSIISRFEDIPKSPLPLRSPHPIAIATKHGIQQIGADKPSVVSSPPAVIGRVQSPFLMRKEYGPIQPDIGGVALQTSQAPDIGGVVSGTTAAPQVMPSASTVPMIRINSAKSSDAEASHGHMTNVTGHMTSDKGQLTSTAGEPQPRTRVDGCPAERNAAGPLGVTAGPLGVIAGPLGVIGVLPTGPEDGGVAQGLCEGWSPHSSDSQELSLPSPTPPPSLSMPQWTSDAGRTKVIPTVVTSVRTEEEDEDTMPVWMETPIDDHLVPIRPRVESEVIRRPTFQHDTAMPPPLQMHPLESPPLRRKNVRPSSLRRWRKRVPSSVLEASSEFTQSLTHSEIHHLNQDQERRDSPDSTKGKGSKLSSLWPKKSKPTSPNAKKGHLASPLAPSPKPKKRQVDFRLSNGVDEKTSLVSDRMRHRFVSFAAPKSEHCRVCNKTFSGALKQAMKCGECDEVIVHKHCMDRAPPCKARIASGNYVTMSRKKVIKNLDDIYRLRDFLFDKLSALNSANVPYTSLEQVFQKTLTDFSSSLLSTYSLQLAFQPAGNNSTPANNPATTPTDVPATRDITFSQLIQNFSNIFKGVAKKEGLCEAHLAIGINQFRTILDEFTKQTPKSIRSEKFDPSTLKRKKVSGADIEIKSHKGHRFARQQFKVRTVCELCNGDIPLLERGEVCEECGYTCHEDCYRSTTLKCEGKDRVRTAEAPKTSVSQFGVPLELLVPKDRGSVPNVVEKCFQYIEAHGLYALGIYRKSAGAGSKKMVRAALEEDTLSTEQDTFNIHAVASTIGTFFRELPEPLLTRELYIEFIRATEITDRTERLQVLHQLVGRLPPLNHVVFERLIFHLARVAQQEHTNKMGAGNLAIVFAPTLLRSSTDNPQDVLTDLPKQTQCLEEIIHEQVNKLNVTLKDIETLDTIARSREYQLTKLVKENRTTPQPLAPSGVQGEGLQTEPVLDTLTSSSTGVEATRVKLTRELQEIERERVELTVNLPTLEPFSFTHDEWLNGATPPSFRQSLHKSIHDARTAEALQEESLQREAPGELLSTTPLSHLTKNRAQLPSKRPPTRGTRWSEPAAERNAIQSTLIGKETTL